MIYDLSAVSLITLLMFLLRSAVACVGLDTLRLMINEASNLGLSQPGPTGGPLKASV